jgi:mono/diheme cytochrome c family protein
MKTRTGSRRSIPIFGGAGAIILAILILGSATSPTAAGDPSCNCFFHRHFCRNDIGAGHIQTMNGGYWLWVRSPEQEKVVVVSLYNRYCIRCHGSDGRGVWDMPGVPDFTDVRWQASRTDDQIVRITLEGRGACMPQFRGALSIEETWGIARYLRSFAPGTEIPKPDVGGSATRRATAKPATTTTTTPNPASESPVARPAIPPPAVRGTASPAAS